MKITAETTDEQILAPIKFRKQLLLAFVEGSLSSDTMAGEGLVDAAQAVKNAESLAHVQIRYRNALKARISTERRMATLFEIATQSASHDNVPSNVVRWATEEIDNIRFSA